MMLTPSEDTGPLRYFVKDHLAIVTNQDDMPEDFTEVDKEGFDIMVAQILEERQKRVEEVTLRIKDAKNAAVEDKVQSLIIAGLPEAAARILVDKN